MTMKSSDSDSGRGGGDSVGIGKKPYCGRTYRAGSTGAKILERLYVSQGRSLPIHVFSDVEKKHVHGLAARQLVDIATVVAEAETGGDGGGGGHHYCRTCRKTVTLTAPGIAHYIASKLGLSFAYAVYLAYLYVESRDPAYAFTLAGGDARWAEEMVEGKVEYPYGLIYSPNADKKFEGANMFVLGTYVEEKGCCLDGIVPEIARHELSRKGIVRCSPNETLMVTHEKYRELRGYDVGLRAVVEWADGVSNQEVARRMPEAAAVLVGGVCRNDGRSGSLDRPNGEQINQTNNKH